MNTARFDYVTYLSTTPEKVWKALTDPTITREYWQHENISDWKPGSKWEHRSSNQDATLDVVGNVVESSPPRRLVLTWASPDDESREKNKSLVTFEIEPFRGVVRLTVTHERLALDSELIKKITENWPKVLSSLIFLIERGQLLSK